MKKKNSGWEKYKWYFIIPIGIYLVWKVWMMIKAAQNLGKDINHAIKNDATGTAVKNALAQNGIDPGRASSIVEICDNIYSAFWKDSFWGWGEDEQKAIDNFNALYSTGEARAAKEIYRANFQKNLYQDMYKYCNGDHYKQIKQSLLNATK